VITVAWYENMHTTRDFSTEWSMTCDAEHRSGMTDVFVEDLYDVSCSVLMFSG
jgi:hypothetical protein